MRSACYHDVRLVSTPIWRVALLMMPPDAGTKLHGNRLPAGCFAPAPGMPPVLLLRGRFARIVPCLLRMHRAAKPENKRDVRTWRVRRMCVPQTAIAAHRLGMESARTWPRTSVPCAKRNRPPVVNPTMEWGAMMNEQAICDDDAYCCTVLWDATCALVATTTCSVCESFQPAVRTVWTTPAMVRRGLRWPSR